MVKSFRIDQPQSIHFGPGSREEIPGLVRGLGRRVVLLTGRSWFPGSEWEGAFGELLKGFQVQPLACPGGEPETETVASLLEQARAFAPDAILAVGGGSVLDTAKVLSGLLPLRAGARGEAIEDYLEGVGKGLQVPGPGTPWIAVPTTAGTGAEVTKNAVLKAPALQAKKSLRSPHILATSVVVDPQLAVGCPLRVTGITGMDALTQLVESFVSRKAAPVPRAWARDAFPGMLAALLRLPEDLADLETRSAAAYGALASGFALANSGLGAAHGFASGIGGVYDIPHGLLCALFIRPVLRANSEVIRKDLALLRASVRERRELFEGITRLPDALAAVLRGEAAQPDPEEAVDWLVGTVDALFGMYGLPRDLGGYPVDPGRVSELAKRSSGSSMSGNPRELPQEERERIIRSQLPGYGP
ncbi:MAG: iron-containing alcohol dehydrogenase [Spirochaetales bacterium]|nr:iron-containing alcohol dehydrogenase [Spirochaetales bacterium]